MNCTGKRCIMQHDKVDPATCECVKYCPEATPPKTNADKIRAMSDEELANFLCRLNRDCYECPADNMCSTRSGYTDGMLKWLREEAKE